MSTEKSAEEYKKEAENHRKAVSNMRKTFLKTGIFIAAAMIAIIILTSAWFISNSKVSADGVAISANDLEKYRIASAGTRQMAEQEQYKSNGENILTDIDDETYSSFYDTLTEKMITPQENLKLYKGTAWHLQDNGTMQPGVRGVLEFYVIPQVDGLTEIFFAINIAGYQKTSDEKNPVALVEDSVLNDLLKGHILFFEKLDDVDGYSGWLGGDEKEIRVKDKSGSLQKDLPYKVTIYWIWPKRYRNFIYHQRSTQGDLFATESGDYKALISFINENQKKFFYNYKKPMESITTEIDMNDEAYTLGTAYYNAADEYIGTNIRSNSIAFYVHPRLP